MASVGNDLILMKISIVMPTYRRPEQLDKTLASIRAQASASLAEIIVVEDGDQGDGTPQVCARHGADYICRSNRPDTPFSCPSIPFNIGIRAAIGDVLILQNPECMHVNNVIDVLAGLVTPRNAVYASVRNCNEDGSIAAWMVHPTDPWGIFHCGAIYRDILMLIGGFDEDYIYWGFEDRDLQSRLMCLGLEFIFTPDAVAHHQWHWRTPDTETVQRLGKIEEERHAYRTKRMLEGTGSALFDKRGDMTMVRQEFGVIRNIGKDWGSNNMRGRI
jgi:glycosyltransferase involved in cell wall biosynthesis